MNFYKLAKEVCPLNTLHLKPAESGFRKNYINPISR